MHVQCPNNSLILMFRNQLFLKQYYKKYMQLLCREVKGSQSEAV